RHPLAAFFVFAYGLSWLVWLPYVLSQNGLKVLPLSYPVLLGQTQVLGVLPGLYLGPVTAAVVVTALTEGRRGLRAWRRRLLNVRVRWTWWVGVAAAVPFAIIAATFLLPGAAEAVRPISPFLLLGYLPMLALQVVTTAFGEEPGWRDFALPQLQGLRGPLLGTVILGLLWGGWHLPLFLTTDWGGWPDESAQQPILFIAGCVPLSLVMTWVFNRTGQSVPVVMLLHASINSTYSLIWPALFPSLNAAGLNYTVQLVATVAATLVLLIATRGRLGLAHDTPRRVRGADRIHEDLEGTRQP
ncbi:MAG: CPBP family intramembrane metalloprotease, partial [Propionibacteriaceae bacterium]